MLQIISNTFASFCLLLMLGLSLGLIYRTTKVLDISFAGVVVIGSYALYLSVVSLGRGWMLGLLLALTVAISVACGVHCLMRLGRRQSSNAQFRLLLASLGVYVVQQNAIAIAFGNDTKVFHRGPVKIGHSMFGAHLTDVQLLTIGVGLSLFATVLLLIRYTRLGRGIQGVSSDPELAEALGANVKRIQLWAVGLGAGLGASAGMLTGLDTGMTPTMGFRLLLNGMIVMIVGGIGSISGLLGGALVLAVAQNYAAYYASNRWADTVSFLILIGFLIWKPLGFRGRKLIKVEV